MPFFRKLASYALVLALSACASHPSTDKRAPSSLGPIEYASQKLQAKGLNQGFIDLITSHYREDQREKVLDLNLLGFLKSNQATGNEKIPGWELDHVQKFIAKNRRTFREAEKQFDVEKEAIASLLWVETKHGKDLGTFHVSSALLSLVQADYPTLVDQLLDTARKRSAEYDKLIENRIQERARTKGEWAAGELLALQEIHQKGWKDVAKLHGSFSGAFGMAQFIPSSYLAWAKTKRKNPNLFRADDSILSVGNYLKSNGWIKGDRPSQEGALFHYNRDRAYVTRILKMSECVRRGKEKTKKQKRSTASLASC